jgi:hypothetical protein
MSTARAMSTVGLDDEGRLGEIVSMLVRLGKGERRSGRLASHLSSRPRTC